jgi:hypothetical protein
MSKVTVEIEDDLQERVDGVKDEIKSDFLEWFEENYDPEIGVPDGNELGDDFYQHEADAWNEYSDSWTPVYYSEIDSLFYLYSNDLEQAYDDAGCYNEPPDNYKQVCIYFYIEQESAEVFNEIKDALIVLEADEYTLEQALEQISTILSL